MSQASYVAKPGEHILHACRAACEQAKARGKDVSFKFNDVLMVATPRSKPESMEKKFHAILAEEAEAYRKSPAGVLSERKYQLDTAERQKKVDWLLQLLPDVIFNMDELMKWLQEFVPLADWSGVKIPHAQLLKEFEDSGYVNGEYVGMPPEWFNTPELLGRWNIGQAMNYLARGFAPHPMCAVFAERYFEKQADSKESHHRAPVAHGEQVIATDTTRD